MQLVTFCPFRTEDAASFTKVRRIPFAAGEMSRSRSFKLKEVFIPLQSWTTHPATYLQVLLMKRLRPILSVFPAIFFVGFLALSLPAQDGPAVGSDMAEMATESSGPDLGFDGKERTLRFTFEKTPWREVLLWAADENELSFNLDIEPTGTLTFIDPDRKYSAGEALDEINGQLLAKGYTLVRRNRNLYILDLETELDQKFIRDLLDEIPLADLDKRGRFELTKTRFQLTSVTAEAAKEQIEELIGPQGSIVTIPLARQLVITESGENLRRVRHTLETVEKQLGGEVKAFPLKLATGEDVMLVAKQLLGIEPDASSADDDTVSVSMNQKGTVVYAKGTPDKIAIVKQVVEQVEKAAGATNDVELTFSTHSVRRGDPETVLRVVETLLSGDPRVRLQAGTDNIMAFATAEQHKAIDDAIAEIEIAPTRIDVIPLRQIAPLEAVTLIEHFFVADGDDSPPVIDAMTNPDKLVVKASDAQIEMIRGLLKGVGERLRDPNEPAGPDSRVLPIDEDTFPEAIELLRKMWPEVGNGNRIRIINNQVNGPLIRVIPRSEDEMSDEEEVPAAEAQPDEAPMAESAEGQTTQRSNLFTTIHVQKPAPKVKQTSFLETTEVQAGSQPNEIVLSLSPEGLIAVSNDSAGLDALEDLLLNVGSNGKSQFSLFHLKHIEAEDAKTMLTSLFTNGAGTATTESDSDSTRTGVMGLFGPAVPGGGVAPSMITDARLNRLFVKGSATQVREVREYLKFIDIESGDVEVETNPKPDYIPVFYTSAESILDVLKSLYADRILDPNQQNRGGGRGGFNPFGGGGGQTATTDDKPKMSLAADAASNLIVVSAPGPLLREVKEVVRELDNRAEAAPSETSSLGRLKTRASPEVIKKALKGAYGDFIQTEGDGIVVESSNTNSSSTANSAAQSAEARRAAFFQAIRGGGGGSDRGGGGGGRGGGRGR